LSGSYYCPWFSDWSWICFVRFTTRLKFWRAF